MKFFLFIILFLPIVSFSKTVVIFYSSIGLGHEKAAEAIIQDLKEKDSEINIVSKDIRDFMPEVNEKLDRKIYFQIYSHFPNMMNWLFEKRMANGLSVVDFDKFSAGWYNLEKVGAYLKDIKPDVVLATHYGSAIVMAKAREKGYFSAKLIWVFTDYLEYFFPRISLRVDKTFVPHKSMKSYWEKFGVDSDSVDVSVIPIIGVKAGSVENMGDSASSRKSGVSFTLAGGSEGLKDNVSIISSLLDSFTENIEINVFVGKNKKSYDEVLSYSKKLPSRVQLNLFGFVPRDKVISTINDSDLYITKGGGLSPLEGVLLNKPLVIVDEFGGHDRSHSDFFEKNHLAVRVKNSTFAGETSRKLLNDKNGIEVMLNNQKEFSTEMSIDKISSEVLNANSKDFEVTVEKFGSFMGQEVNEQQKALEKLNKDYPSNLEILLGYSTTKSGKYFDKGKKSNPFGHIAIRIYDKVYTVNYRDLQGEETFHIESSLSEYLYSTKKFAKHYEFAGMNGQAYGRETIGLRVRGISDSVLVKMKEELEILEQKFSNQNISYDAKSCNCATLVRKILQTGGLLSTSSSGSIALPIDVFQDVMEAVEKSNLEKNFVRYAFIKGSASGWVTGDVPLTARRPFKSIAKVFRNFIMPKKINFLVDPDAQIDFSLGQKRSIFYENLKLKSVRSECLWFYLK